MPSALKQRVGYHLFLFRQHEPKTDIVFATIGVAAVTHDRYRRQSRFLKLNVFACQVRRKMTDNYLRTYDTSCKKQSNQGDHVRKVSHLLLLEEARRLEDGANGCED